MGTQDLKTQILKALEKVPENALEEVLEFLQEVQERGNASFANYGHVQMILKEDEALLKQLT